MVRCTGMKIHYQAKTLHNLVIGDVNPEANMYLRKVLARLHDDEISRIAKNDLLIIIYGNYEAFKYRNSCHHNKQIRAEMRLLA